jgi:hypothetical protein
MLVYISFSKTATPTLVEQAAKTVLNLPIQTLGAWNDGSTTQSMLQLLNEYHKNNNNNTNNNSLSPISIMLVPQANLIAKIKKNGKSIQYHDQIDKDEGEKLYNMFVELVKTMLIDHHELCIRGETGQSSSTSSNKSMTTPDPSIPPNKIFKLGILVGKEKEYNYGSYDEITGIPLTSQDGQPITKSAKKKLQKNYDSHMKRHEKWKLQQQQQQQQQENSQSSSAVENDAKSNITKNVKSLDPSFVQLVSGSFGKRQGLEMFSDMGPFCHVIET